MWEFFIYYVNWVFFYGNLCLLVFYVVSNWCVLLVVMYWFDWDKLFYIEYLFYLEYYNIVFFVNCVCSKYFIKSVGVILCSFEY